MNKMKVKKMPYDAHTIANWFIDRAKADSGKVLSIMSLLKLPYISHGWCLGLQDKQLFSNRIEAWRFGPVIPDVYHTFKNQGTKVVHKADEVGSSLKKKDKDFLEQIYSVYGNIKPWQLSKFTHVKGGPWDIAFKTGGLYAQISDDLIKQYYLLKCEEARRSGAVKHGV